MKQTKKLTRNQREFLQKLKINTEGLRFDCENANEILFVKPDGKILRYDKAEGKIVDK